MSQSILALVNDPRYTSANLTIREQARLAENPNELRWVSLAPYRGVSSIKLSEIERELPLRLVADRREWNAKGRMAHTEYGPAREYEITPIEMEYALGEREMTLLRESGVESLVRAGIITRIDDWAPKLADGVYNRIEYEFFEAWQKNQITVHDPKTNANQVVPLGISADRYVTENDDYLTLETANAGSAFPVFLQRVEESEQHFRTAPARAVRLRRAMLNLLRQSAAVYYGQDGVMKVEDLQQAITDEGFGEFSFVVDERTLDKYNDAGFEHTATKLVEASKLLFQPASGVIGSTAFAPVVRAYDFVDGDRRDGVVRNVAIFLNPENEGRTLKVQAQANALPLPDEDNVFVVEAGAPTA